MKRLPYERRLVLFGPPCFEGKYRTIWVPVVGRITVHPLTVRQFRGAFWELKLRGWKKCVDRKDYRESGGTFVCRKARGSKNWSSHSMAFAIDINPKRFAMNATKLPPNPWPLYQDRIRYVFAKWGFVNLDHDRMHFEVAHIMTRRELKLRRRLLQVLWRKMRKTEKLPGLEV